MTSCEAKAGATHSSSPTAHGAMTSSRISPMGKLDFSALGLGFDDFIISQDGNDTVITLIDGTNQSVTLQNFVSLDLDASD